LNIDQLRTRFPDENACREFFESVIWQNGRRCPHCDCQSSYLLSGLSSRPGLYECGSCKRQFTVTTRTPMHSTKLPLWKWLLCMYFMVNSSKGVSSVFMGKWLGVAQRTAWKMGHAVRRMMEPSHEGRPPLNGIVELDEKYFGGKPRYEKGVTHKRGKGTEKQGVLVAVERQGQVRSALIASDQAAELRPLVERFVDQQAHLMTDQNWAYQQIGKDYAAHSWVNHSEKEFARGNVHNNTAESFNSLLERAKQGIFHYMSQKHLPRYLNEIGFRWIHRVPKRIVTKNRKRKTVMVALPVIDMLCSLLTHAIGRQLRRKMDGGVRVPMANLSSV
jgi:transposase-like protein